MAVIISSGSAPASTSPTAKAVTPKRRPAADACSAKSSEPAVNRTADAPSSRKPITQRRYRAPRMNDVTNGRREGVWAEADPLAVTSAADASAIRRSRNSGRFPCTDTAIELSAQLLDQQRRGLAGASPDRR